MMLALDLTSSAKGAMNSAPDEVDDVKSNANIILNETSEFCRNLGAWQTTSGRESARHTGASDETQVAPEILEFEDSLMRTSANNDVIGATSAAASVASNDEDSRGQWAVVEADDESNTNDGFLYDRIASTSRSGGSGGLGDLEGHQKGRDDKGQVLDDEPDLSSSGLVAAIKLAQNKGYLETNEKKTHGSNLKHLEAKNYSIDDKT